MNIPNTIVSVYLLIKVSPVVCTLATPCPRVSISIFIRIYVSYEYTHTMLIKKTFISVCTSPSNMCVLKHHLDPDQFHPYLRLFQKPEHVIMWAYLHQEWWIQTKQNTCKHWQVNAKQNTCLCLHTCSYKMKIKQRKSTNTHDRNQTKDN